MARPTPKEFNGDVESRAWERGLEQGRLDGLVEAHKGMLTLLEEKYLNMDVSPQDDTMKAVIVLARELAIELRKHTQS